MEKKKKGQLFLILAVIALTVYNILPTLFYYTKPLKSPIGEAQGQKIAAAITERVQTLGSDAQDWLASYCELLHIRPQSIAADGQNLLVTFTKSEEAALFRKFFPRAGALISFAPAQMGLAPQDEIGKSVLVQRRIPASLKEDFFAFAAKGTPLYRNLIIDRAAQIAYTLAGPSEHAFAIASLDPKRLEPLALQLQFIEELAETDKTAAAHFAAHFMQGPFSDRAKVVEALISAFEAQKTATCLKAAAYLKKNTAQFIAGLNPLSLPDISAHLEHHNSLLLGACNPLFSEVSIDWEKEQIVLKLHPGLPALEQPLINEIAKIQRTAGETVAQKEGTYAVAFHTLPECSSLVCLDLGAMAQEEGRRLQTLLQTKWHPQHPDLQNLPIFDLAQYETLSPEEQALGLVVIANTQLRIIAHGLDRIAHALAQFPDSAITQQFNADVRALAMLLAQNGFEMHPNATGDLVFEKQDLFDSLLMATREAFHVKGTRKYATLELSNLEHRLLSLNRIDTKIHEDLMKWNDEFRTAQVSLQPGAKFDVPKPTRSVFLSNLALSWTKFFRGDERKVIHWGLDLSGGKTVQIELRDQHHNLVTHDDDLKQGINELYTRVNKMGVSEVAIRQVGNNIVLDFPGSQSMSASELIRASTMYFHVINEKFSSPYSPLASVASRFLTEVWNEAVITGHKEARDLNRIAWEHLYGKNPSESAKTLLENGLVLQSPNDLSMGPTLDDTVSKIAVYRDTSWHGQTHPLLFVFRNVALEGSSLDQVQANYDPQKGNYLSFSVAPPAQGNLYAWTSHYAKEKVYGTELEAYTPGQGWRMAVVLNDTVISAPTLDGVLQTSASISGSFSQREVNLLAADLKAGSLTFTPHILSEKNVSPELGQKDRAQGIFATIVALVLVIGAMLIYYRFAGLVASVAVIFNLLILWATLQNMGATLSLAGIAGIILTVGMAVDANVLVFERVKEEFALSGKIASAIRAGYEKAFNAIVDSNVTTIIAALILLNFDAGPIKGFAVTLIIGIASSMFTALFMTRFYFNRWVENPKHQVLHMAHWFKAKSINFLKGAKIAFAITLAIIVGGGALLFAKRSTIFGMDFTGGYALHLSVAGHPNPSPLVQAEAALRKAGADFQIRELDSPQALRVLFSPSMELSGKPFYGMPLEIEKKQSHLTYETNPRIAWVVNTLSASGITLTPNCLAHLEKDWTSVSGQMSDSMRNSALFGLLIAFLAIFIYIAFRFEYTFAAASILCLFHDVLITLGVMGVLHFLGVPVQIDLNTVAAIMTIVGYSLNDTIIIFDRIREEMRLAPTKALPSIVNMALNTTLSRTSITSGTTLLVLLALVVLGGASIFSFALVMTIGVIFGTLSSWYIAPPLMLFFQAREQKLAERSS